MNEYIEKPDMQYILHIKSDKKVEKRLIDYCLESVVDVFEDTGLTADVQPVKRGRWEQIGEQNAKCIACGGVLRSNGIDRTGKSLIFNAVYHYCPFCGARMDGDSE